MCVLCCVLGSALRQFHCWLGPSFYEYLIYSISVNIVKSKNRMHFIIISSSSSSTSTSSTSSSITSSSITSSSITSSSSSSSSSSPSPSPSPSRSRSSR